MSIESIQIRDYLNPGDLGKVIELHARIYVSEMGFEPSFEFYVAKAVGQLFNENKDSHRYWVAEHADQMIGFIALMHHPTAAQLRFFVIDGNYRGIGLGRRLLNCFFDYFYAQDYSSCFLLTTDGLDQAIHLYQSYGFKLVGSELDRNFKVPLNELKFELLNE